MLKILQRRRNTIGLDEFADLVLAACRRAGALDERDEHVDGIVRSAVRRAVAHPGETFEVIVDRPGSANWRLKADRVSYVRLADYSLGRSPARTEAERTANAEIADAAARLPRKKKARGGDPDRGNVRVPSLAADSAPLPGSDTPEGLQRASESAKRAYARIGTPIPR